MVSCSRRPMSPAAIRSCTSRNEGSKRRLKPTITVGFSAAISVQHRSTRARSRSIGFSQSTAFPARTARVSRSTWVGVAEAMTTASTLGSSMAASTVGAVAAPYRLATSSAADSIGSYTQASSARGWTSIESACTRPIRPQPKRPKRINLDYCLPARAPVR